MVKRTLVSDSFYAATSSQCTRDRGRLHGRESKKAYLSTGRMRSMALLKTILKAVPATYQQLPDWDTWSQINISLGTLLREAKERPVNTCYSILCSRKPPPLISCGRNDLTPSLRCFCRLAAGAIGAAPMGALGRRGNEAAEGMVSMPGEASPDASPEEQDASEWAVNAPGASEEGAGAANDEGDLEFPLADLDADADADVDPDEEDDADVKGRDSSGWSLSLPVWSNFYASPSASQ